MYQLLTVYVLFQECMVNDEGRYMPEAGHQLAGKHVLDEGNEIGKYTIISLDSLFTIN